MTLKSDLKELKKWFFFSDYKDVIQTLLKYGAESADKTTKNDSNEWN